MTVKLKDVIDLINSTYDNRKQMGASDDVACEDAIRVAAHAYDVYLQPCGDGLRLSKQDVMGLALSVSVLIQRSGPFDESDKILQMALSTIGEFYVQANKIVFEQ
jgi:hypothetical protein